jgi:hypothetical protein
VIPPVMTPPVTSQPLTTPPLTYQPQTSPTVASFGRNIGNTGTTAVASSKDANAGASGTTTATTAVGDAELSGNASGSTQALAKFGITGVSVAAGAEGHTDVMVTIGDGYVTYGVQGDVMAQAKAGPTGVKASAEALAQTDVKGGAEGSLHGAGTGNVSATVATFALAKSTNEYGLKLQEGKFVVSSKNTVGVGASIGATAGISGSGGSVSIGTTVYSPGTLGGTFSATAGYSGGKISVGLNLGAEIGIGGLDVNIAFSVDADKVVNGLATFGEKTAGFIGYKILEGNEEPGPNELVTNGNAIGDAAARYAYFVAHPDWAKAQHDVYGEDYQEAVKFTNGYRALLEDTARLISDEAANRAKFLDLLKTDPAAAVEFSHSSNFAERAKQTERDLLSRATAYGVALQVVEGKLAYK